MKIFWLGARTMVIFTVAFISGSTLGAQTRSVAIVGGTLIDGTGRAPVENATVVMLDGRIQAAGKRDEVTVPQESSSHVSVAAQRVNPRNHPSGF